MYLLPVSSYIVPNFLTPINTQTQFSQYMEHTVHNVCQRSLDPIHIVTNYMKCVKTFGHKI